MFSGCTSLVGGDGTKYNLSYMDKTKAYAGQGGYLTLKVAARGLTPGPTTAAPG